MDKDLDLVKGIQANKPTLEYFSSFAAAVNGQRRRQKADLSQIDEAVVAQMEEWFALGGSLPVGAIREAIGVGPWDSLMLDAMHKRLVKGWEAVAQALHWNKIVSFIKPVKDFRNQYALQVGGFTTAEKVPEKADYHEIEMTDDRAEYKVAKYGQIFALSWEAMTNDDLGAFGQTAQRLGGMMARTVEDFVFGTMLDDNPTLYDSIALFHNTHANNLGSGKALSHDNLEAGIKLLMAQTDIEGNPLDIKPKYLIVHPNEYYEALRLVKSPARPATANNDINVHYGELEVIPTARVTSTRWFVMADPAQIETFEIGFLGGRQQPEIFEEGVDGMFRSDVKRWKARHVFGGAWVDYRGIVRGNVA
jgi:hypothetical protein